LALTSKQASHGALGRRTPQRVLLTICVAVSTD